MGQRNTLYTHQMPDLQPGQAINHIHPGHCIFSSDIIDYTNRSLGSVLSSSTNTVDLGLQSRDYHDSMFYRNQYNSIQNFHAVPNPSLSAAAPSNFYNPCMLPSPSDRVPHTPWNYGSVGQLPSSISQGDSKSSLDEVGWNSQFVDSDRSSGKRKNEVAPGNYYSINGPASSSSSPPLVLLNNGLPQWDQSYDSRDNLVDTTHFAPPEYCERGIMQAAEGLHRSVKSRSDTVCLQSEAGFFPHQNYVFQGHHMGQPLHCPSSGWMPQFGIANNIGDGVFANWNYAHTMPNLNGRCHVSGAVEMTNMGMQAYHDASTSTNSAILFNPPLLPNFHQHQSPMQTMQVQNHTHPAHIPAPPYQHLHSNLHPCNLNPSSHGLDSGSRCPHFLPSAEQIFRPWQLHHPAPEFINGRVRILSSEDAGIMELSGFYGVGNFTDQHQDMRLDIDQMTYEELLALEEQIGDVKTGLKEEYIMKKLKTSVRAPKSTSLPSDHSCRYSQENEACIICQVEYEEDEFIGTLECGHHFHGECIKQWLKVKNLCPICKTTALPEEKVEG